MIDIKSGLIFIGINDEIEIGPRMSRKAFLNLETSKMFSIMVENPPWFSYGSSKFEISGVPFSINLFFKDDKLNKIQLGIIDPRFGTSWENWSLQRELDRKKAHDDWLKKELGSRRIFPWGTILSIMDEKAGYSSIIFDYKPMNFKRKR